jgi:hypothetical protein
MTTPVIVQPDLEAWVRGHINHIPGVTSYVYAATQQNGAGWVYAHFVQVDVRDAVRQAARDMAEQVRQTILALPDVPWDEGTICYVQAVEGPAWFQTEDGPPRYMARYEIRVHPRRTVVAAP